MARFWHEQNRPKTLRRTLIALAGAGSLILAYLTRLHYSTGGSSFCNFAPGLSCDLVNQSTYSEIFGIPVAVLGLLFFLTVIVILLNDRRPGYFALTLILTCFALTFSLSLSAVEVFILRTICLLCETTKVIMAVMIAVSAYGAGLGKEKIRPLLLAGALGGGILFGLVVAFGS